MLRALLVQLPIPPLSPEPVRGNVPLAAGYLKLFAEARGLGKMWDISILPAEHANTWGDRAFADAIVEHAPDLVGFTCYLWNIDRTLNLAAAVKARSPGSKILIGGPEITFDNDWVLGGDAWDLAAIGEGEVTFAEILEAGLADEDRLAKIAGLRVRSRPQAPFLPRTPMPNLDAISSPYLSGILDAADQEMLLLETIRGCIFNCRFCYYPKSYDKLYYVSDEKIVANLAHAHAAGAREVFLLDPTLNQRRDFGEFLELLARSNPDRQLEYHAELRAEGLKPEHATLMRKANFKNVEIGLQSVGPAAQELMDRRNNLKAFEAGVRALKDNGITAKVDLIVGLPGDTEESIRRGMDYLVRSKMWDEIQVFQLSILPGTEFRANAKALGLEFQDRPPYYVTKTPLLDRETMLGLLEESEDLFDVEFDAIPAPILDGLAPTFGVVRESIFDLDSADAEKFDVPARTAQAFTIKLRARDFWKRIGIAEALVRRHIAQNPFSTVQIVVEARGEFPLDVVDRLRAAAERPVNSYLDRFYAFTPKAGAGATRIITTLPKKSKRTLDASWIDALLESAEIVWIGGASPSRIIPGDDPGEWLAE